MVHHQIVGGYSGMQLECRLDWNDTNYTFSNIAITCTVVFNSNSKSGISIVSS